MTDIDVPQAVALMGIPDVELVALGSWNASTGKAVITDDDLRAGVAALDCPGVHNPVLKLGHQEPDPDAQKMRWDGTPAVGWVSNLRLSDNGSKILGDYTGVPAWLAKVMPSAYPQRSVEIQRNFRCQVGHTHPFVITAVSLLGVVPPAVGVIRSLQDVQALYTLAAHGPGEVPPEVIRSIETRLAVGDPGDPRRALTDVEIASGADFDRDRDEWETAVAALLSAYSVVQRRQREQLTAQIAPLVDAGRLDDLAALAVDSEQASALLYAEMLAAAQAAIDLQIAEAAAQGIIGLTAAPDELYLRKLADGIAATMAGSLAAAAGRDAAQLAAPGVTGAAVADTVAAKLSDLSDRFLRDQFAGAIGAARAAGRHQVLSVAPDGTFWASEINDANTCKPCKDIDGMRFANLDSAMQAYGAGGYHLCAGGGRCRGRFVAVWNIDTIPLPDPTDAVLAIGVGDTTRFARVVVEPSRPTFIPVRIVGSPVGRTLRFKFDPSQKRDKDGKWTDGPPGVGGSGTSPLGSDAKLLKDKPWEKEDRGFQAPGKIYTDEAELNAYKLLDGYKRIEPDVTKSLTNIAERAGGRMEGLEFRMKGQESLARKIEQKSATKGLAMKEYTAKIGDALRYTMILKPGSYGKDAQEAINDFRKQGYEVEVENTWTPGSSYKGINTNMKRNGQIFEVQFHTDESFTVKMDQHVLYERARDTTLSPEERADATAKMAENAAAMTDPVGAGDVK